MSVTYESLRDEAMDKLKSHMDSLEESKGRKLAYWVRDYARFLKKEGSFDPRKNVRYKRGSVIKVHLGFRIGSEEGGLHYAIVLDCNNQLSSPTVTVIPLTSIKPTTNLSRLHFSQLSLGSEIYDLLNEKLDKSISSLTSSVNELQEKADALADDDFAGRVALQVQHERLYLQLNNCKDVANEVKRMKNGSIALVGQITTVSKIRIYDPQYASDPLYGLRVSDKTLNMLDNAICEMFTGTIKKSESATEKQE